MGDKSTSTRKQKKLTKFELGFICCLSNTVHGHGINTAEQENYRHIGSPTPEQCRKSGLGEYDIDAIQRLYDLENAEWPPKQGKDEGV